MAKNHSNLGYRKKRNLRDFYFINSKNGCWEWIRALMTGGYASFWYEGKNVKASRFFYEKFIGKIPKGLQLDHLCRNRKCVNPKHLEPVTLKENLRRGLRSRLGRRFLNEQQVKEIRKLYKEKEYIQIELSKMFGVGQDEISRIINYRRWNFGG